MYPYECFPLSKWFHCNKIGFNEIYYLNYKAYSVKRFTFALPLNSLSATRKMDEKPEIHLFVF